MYVVNKPFCSGFNALRLFIWHHTWLWPLWNKPNGTEVIHCTSTNYENESAWTPTPEWASVVVHWHICCDMIQEPRVIKCSFGNRKFAKYVPQIMYIVLVLLCIVLVSWCNNATLQHMAELLHDPPRPFYQIAIKWNKTKSCACFKSKYIKIASRA